MRMPNQPERAPDVNRRIFDFDSALGEPFPDLRPTFCHGGDDNTSGKRKPTKQKGGESFGYLTKPFNRRARGERREKEKEKEREKDLGLVKE